MNGADLHFADERLENVVFVVIVIFGEDGDLALSREVVPFFITVAVVVVFVGRILVVAIVDFVVVTHIVVGVVNQVVIVQVAVCQSSSVGCGEKRGNADAHGSGVVAVVVISVVVNDVVGPDLSHRLDSRLTIVRRHAANSRVIFPLGLGKKGDDVAVLFSASFFASAFDDRVTFDYVLHHDSVFVAGRVDAAGIPGCRRVVSGWRGGFDGGVRRDCGGGGIDDRFHGFASAVGRLILNLLRQLDDQVTHSFAFFHVEEPNAEDSVYEKKGEKSVKAVGTRKG